MAATIAQHQKGNKAHIRPIIVLYLIGTFSAALTAVIAGMVFPTHIVLAGAGDVSAAPPSGIVEVLKSLLMNLVANPINAIANANYIGILAWALVLGAALRNHGSDVTRQVVADLAEAVSTVVKWIIRFAPLGIFGLVSSTIAETGFGALAGYAKLLAVLLGCMRLSRWRSIPPSCGGKSAATLIRWCLPACAKAACMPSLPVLPPPISP
ncbi:dicarboxylate symporter family protein [Neisseria gonorrhoeae]|nr:dicarboxylate symporter family protein [Neisseria gonorrhoeae]